MCMSCGCNKPNEQHGDQRNIVMSDLNNAAQAAKTSTADVVRNIQTAFQQSGGRETAGQMGKRN